MKTPLRSHTLRPSHRTLALHAILLSGTFLGISAFAAPPLFEERFNGTGDLELKNGATLGPSGTGASGHLGDGSYAADCSALADPQQGPAAVAKGETTPAQGLEELTITAWYKPRAELKHDATLFVAVGTTLIWDQKAGEWVLRIDTKPADNPNPSMYWFHSGNKPPLSAWATPNQWTFLAAVWRKADNKVTFYQGSGSAATALAKESTRSETVEPLNERADSPRTIGNRTGSIMDRPFDGNIDDVRFYPKALDAATIEKIRQADLQNMAFSLP